MCLALLSTCHGSLKFLGEYIDIGFDANGRLQTRETYDVFFQPGRDVQDLRFACLSPHCLIQDGALSVEVIHPPAQNSDDPWYPRSFKYNEQNETLNAKVAAVDPTPQEWSFSGIVPSAIHPVFPREFPEKFLRLELLCSLGTCFELDLPGCFEASKCYAFRIVLKPARLLNVSDPYILGAELDGHPRTERLQPASVVAPRDCRYRMEDALNKLVPPPDSPELELVAWLRAHICRKQLLTWPIDVHRIVIAYPPGCEISSAEAHGSCSAMRPYTSRTHPRGGVAKETRGKEWFAGRHAFWQDDFECVVRKAWEWLNSYSHEDPKTIEAVVAYLQHAEHQNVAHAIDCLVNASVLSRDQLGKLRANSQDETTIGQRLSEIVANADNLSKFDWKGFLVGYDLRYHFVTEEVRSAEKRREEERVALLEKVKKLEAAVASQAVQITTLDLESTRLGRLGYWMSAMGACLGIMGFSAVFLPHLAAITGIVFGFVGFVVSIVLHSIGRMKKRR